MRMIKLHNTWAFILMIRVPERYGCRGDETQPSSAAQNNQCNSARTIFASMQIVNYQFSEKLNVPGWVCGMLTEGCAYTKRG